VTAGSGNISLMDPLDDDRRYRLEDDDGGGFFDDGGGGDDGAATTIRLTIKRMTNRTTTAIRMTISRMTTPIRNDEQQDDDADADGTADGADDGGDGDDNNNDDEYYDDVNDSFSDTDDLVELDDDTAPSAESFPTPRKTILRKTTAIGPRPTTTTPPKFIWRSRIFRRYAGPQAGRARVSRNLPIPVLHARSGSSGAGAANTAIFISRTAVCTRSDSSKRRRFRF